MATTFLLKHPAQERTHILMYIRFKGQYYKKSIRETIPAKYWNPDKKRARVTRDFKEGGAINDTIDKWDAAAKKTIAHFKEYLNPPSKETFWDHFNSEFYKDDTELIEVWLTDYIQTYIDRHSSGKSISCIKKYTTALHKFQEYEKHTKKRLRFEDVNIDFYNDFRTWFFKQGFSTNYFGNMIKVLKQIYSEAKNIDRLHDYSYIEHKDFVGTREETDSIYLNDAELQTLYDLQFTPDNIEHYFKDTYENDLDREQLRKIIASYNLIRDRFLIGAYTGLRVSDYIRLQDANFSGKFIRLRTKKTDTDTVIPMNAKVQEMVARNDFSKNISDQKINKHIKEICRMAGITGRVLIHKSEAGKRVEHTSEKCDLVTTHTARRSFATNAYKAGVPPIAIMKITGHRKEATFLKYIKVSAEENAEMLSNHPFFK